jgi:transcriptional regulator with XRE-family HTH domain
LGKHIGEGIKNFREKIGWSQRELARNADISHSLIAGIEKKEINPSLRTLQKISDALKIPISQFFLEVEYSQTTHNKERS